MSVEHGAPPANNQESSIAPAVKTLVERAMTDPGEWFHIDIPDETTAASMRSSLTYNVAKAVAEWTVKNGKVYLKFGTR